MSTARVWQEKVKFKTYLTGSQDKHPIFLENRVYQGSSGAVYPYGVTDTLQDASEIKEYNAVYLENDYIKIMILPELGGRVQRAYDKVNKRDFVYFNQVIKPALVGLLGPWISGGIEFNWPQHHRPTTFMPVDFSLQNNEDGSVSCVVGEREPMHGLSITTAFTVFKDKALLQIKSRVYNTNDTPRSFLWWSNPAVKGGNGHQSVFPPDVTAVFDHGKRAVIDFPIAHGTYYKVKYDGVDISRYKNIPVPTSYMAWKSTYDFVGAYNHEEDGGLLHVADHHVSPGKKQWSWGYGDFGQAWDRSLTDEDGPYIELMTGVYTDNQPDFTWIDAGEEKEFVQNFLPYAKLGTLQNANTTCALKLERDNGILKMGVYAISPISNYQALVKNMATGEVIHTQDLNLTPCHAILFECQESTKDRLQMDIVDANGSVILTYQEHIKEATPLPEIAKAPAMPNEITSTDEAYFIGQHLDQYHHASRNGYDYYLRGIELDKYDYRNNVALGQFEYNRCNFDKALEYANNGLHRALMLNKNPVCGLGSTLKANILFKLGKLDEAYEDYFRATWSGNTKTNGYIGLAKICACKNQYDQALEFANRALETSAFNQEAMAVKAYSLYQLKDSKAHSYLDEIMEIYPLNPVFDYIKTLLNNNSNEALKFALNGREINYISIAEFLFSIHKQDEALAFFKQLNPCGAIATLIYASLTTGTTRAQLYAKAEEEFNHFVRFPNLVFEREVLGTLTDSTFALNLCASFDYAHRLYDKAVAGWKQVLTLDAHNVEALRGLGIHAFNKLKDIKLARQYYKEALAYSNADERIIFENDLLLKLSGANMDERLALLDKYHTQDCVRDDLKTETVTLLNAKGRIDEAYAMLKNKIFHVFEGGEGKITNQFIINAILRSVQLDQEQKTQEALDTILSALTYPYNLSEGRLAGQTDNDLYFFAAYYAKKLNQDNKVQEYLQKATCGDTNITEQHYYNDQPLDYVFYNALALKCQGHKDEANAIFKNMIDWANKSMHSKVEKDFFAVSLPQLVVLDSDDNQQRIANCYLMKMLGAIGLGDEKLFTEAHNQLVEADPANFKAPLYQGLAKLLMTIDEKF